MAEFNSIFQDVLGTASFLSSAFRTIDCYANNHPDGVVAKLYNNAGSWVYNFLEKAGDQLDAIKQGDFSGVEDFAKRVFNKSDDYEKNSFAVQLNDREQFTFVGPADTPPFDDYDAWFADIVSKDSQLMGGDTLVRDAFMANYPDLFDENGDLDPDFKISEYLGEDNHLDFRDIMESQNVLTFAANQVNVKANMEETVLHLDDKDNTTLYLHKDGEMHVLRDPVEINLEDQDEADESVSVPGE